MSDSSSLDDDSDEEAELNVSRPKPIIGKTDVVDLSFHPSCYNLATANMNGYVRIHKCEVDKEAEESLKLRISKKPCRCISFSADGDDLFVLSKDRSFCTISATTGKEKHRIVDAHRSAPYALTVVDKNLIATGDDDGTLQIWDLRKGSRPVVEDKKFEDYVSDIAVDDQHRLLFAVSGDGTMCSYNARQRKFLVQSENAECDLLCAKVAKGNKKVIVGTASGPLLLFNWQEFAASSDRFPGHPGSVDSMARVTDDILCTASSDGMIRAVHVLPNRFLGVVGDHDGLPVEKIECSHDGSFVASVSHDSTVRFWNVEHLKNTRVNAREKAERFQKNERLAKSGAGHGRREFYSDMDKGLNIPVCELNSSSDDDSDADSEANDDKTCVLSGTEIR